MDRSAGPSLVNAHLAFPPPGRAERAAARRSVRPSRDVTRRLRGGWGAVNGTKVGGATSSKPFSALGNPLSDQAGDGKGPRSSLESSGSRPEWQGSGHVSWAKDRGPLSPPPPLARSPARLRAKATTYNHFAPARRVGLQRELQSSRWPKRVGMPVAFPRVEVPEGAGGTVGMVGSGEQAVGGSCMRHGHGRRSAGTLRTGARRQRGRAAAEWPDCLRPGACRTQQRVLQLGMLRFHAPGAGLEAERLSPTGRARQRAGDRPGHFHPLPVGSLLVSDRVRGDSRRGLFAPHASEPSALRRCPICQWIIEQDHVEALVIHAKLNPNLSHPPLEFEPEDVAREAAVVADFALV